MVYNSRSLCCKNPYGAVAAGQEVLFNIRPARSLGIIRAALCLNHELEEHVFEIPLSWTALEGASDVYSCVLDTSSLLGPVWYYFRLERPDGKTLFLGAGIGAGGVGRFWDSAPKPYQLTVTHPEANSPDWYGKGMTYHIFPDRFRRSAMPDPSGMVGDRTVHQAWGDCPDFLPDEKGEIRNRDFFGGNLGGATEKLPYLESLGVKTIYLSPIFESASNHRYDTADYTKVDPMFGTLPEFEAFCAKAAELGMRVILDGVFNHTGYDSVYFNGRGTYQGAGAAQSQDSPYYSWYDFTKWPDKYSAWWGVYTLPQVNEDDPSYVDFIIENEDSIVRRWIRAGASGWRLDVADELPDEFIERLRLAVKSEKPDAVIIGEVWEDASNKIAYSKRRRYLLGRELDGVMNYPFRDNLIDWLLGGDSKDFVEVMEQLKENYPKENFHNLMNSLGTHDTPRILTVLGATTEEFKSDRRAKAGLRLSPARRELAKKLLKIGMTVMFAFPGSPCVFYGDEAGLEGFEDPFNRCGYPWGSEDSGLIDWFARLSKARNASEALQDGDICFLSHSTGAVLAFERVYGEERVVLAANRGDEEAELVFDWESNAIDILSGDVYEVVNDKLSVVLPPRSAALIARESGPSAMELWRRQSAEAYTRSFTRTTTRVMPSCASNRETAQSSRQSAACPMPRPARSWR